MEPAVAASKQLARNAFKDPVAKKEILRLIGRDLFRLPYVKKPSVKATRSNSAVRFSRPTNAVCIRSWLVAEYAKKGSPVTRQDILAAARAASTPSYTYNLGSISSLLANGVTMGLWNRLGHNQYIP